MEMGLPRLKVSILPNISQQFLGRGRNLNPHLQASDASTLEMQYRFKVFVQNLEVSRQLQAEELGTAQYGVTRFSDLTESEFAMMFGIPQPSQLGLPPSLRDSDNSRLEKLTKSCDWRKAGVIPAVKYQGRKCRSCWAFAAVSNIEALWNIHRHVPRNLSVQEVLDCTYNKTGCLGGYVWDGLRTVFNSSGLSNSLLYPYTGRNQTCQKHQKRTATHIDGYELLPRDENYIARIVASQGPVTALLNQARLQNYQKGIIRSPSQSCNPKLLDHAALIVGYDEVKSRRGSWVGPYWIIQNSWGERWGEKGYFRLHRGTNTCGIAMFAATALVRDSEGKKPVVCRP
ncbi:cathepsin W isoform X1 [Podarcis lilfordi]|uniref:Cathepsin W isoform X1 n=1 Tax=Podarcis lilfordi TaxID=74358 RepID=A0AA35PRS1_9SAUR|nr:cathepsin W isoform X1 [Podarcis lilfordi]